MLAESRLLDQMQLHCNDANEHTFCVYGDAAYPLRAHLQKPFQSARLYDQQKEFNTARSSRPEVFCKKYVLENFTKFTGRQLCQGLFFNKDAGLRPATLLKRRLWHRCLPVNFVKFLRTLFLIEHLGWLLLF